jgi:sugar phosphate isomerase/epimerase
MSLAPLVLQNSATQAQSGSKKPAICLFSKPLQALNPKELAEFCVTLGVEGVDLTVREEGHVLPEHVTRDLPSVVRILGASGLKVPMITTSIVDPDEAATVPIIQTAGDLGIPYLKLGYYHYKQFDDIPQRLQQVRKKVLAIGELCRRHNIQAGFHNHSGAYVGAALWDLREILQGIPEDWVGSYFDGAHATVEGGEAGWRIGMNLLLLRIKMVAVKDFGWQRTPGKKYSEPEFGPLGEGDVRWDEILGMLKKAGFSGPISLHVEYTAAQDNSRKEQERVMQLMKKDLSFLQNALRQSSLI